MATSSIIPFPVVPDDHFAAETPTTDGGDKIKNTQDLVGVVESLREGYTDGFGYLEMGEDGECRGNCW